MNLIHNINKNNLHHAYLLEGGEEIVSKLFLYLENELNFNLNSNPDLYFKKYDTFKIEDARVLNQIKDEKSLSGNEKIIVIKTSAILREAQNAMLKMFEEPIENTYFFLVVHDKNTLLSTFLSRFYFIPNTTKVLNFEKEVTKFLKMNLKERIDFIKDFTAKEDEDEEGYVAPRHKALEFLDTLELKLSENKNKNPKTFEQIFTTRSYLRDHSSSAKTLLEALALNI